MAYNEKLAQRVREALAAIPNVEEKKMFRGIAFMVNHKMCINVSGEELMCRFNPTLQEEVISKNGCREMIMKGKTLKGYAYVSNDVIVLKKEFEFWIKLCLDYNDKAKSSKNK